MKRFWISLLLVMLAVVGVGVASAQDEGRFPGVRGGLGDVGRSVIQVITEQSGLEPREILQQVREGQTLSQIIEANGGDVQAVIDATLAAAEERLAEAVSNGRLTQERADLVLETLPQIIEQALNGELNPMNAGAGLSQTQIGVLQLAAEMTGLSPVEIRAQVQDGTPLAEVLTANGVTVEGFVTEAVERFEARVNVLVADGRLTAEEAQTRVTDFENTLTERLNATANAGVGA